MNEWTCRYARFYLGSRWERDKWSGLCPGRITPWKKHQRLLDGHQNLCGQRGGEEEQSAALYPRKYMQLHALSCFILYVMHFFVI